MLVQGRKHLTHESESKITRYEIVIFYEKKKKS